MHHRKTLNSKPTTDDLIQYVKTFQGKSLDLNLTRFSIKVCHLKNVLSAIPNHVESLSLSNNKLIDYVAMGGSLADAFESVPLTVKSIRIINNELGKIPIIELTNLCKIFKCTSLSLRGNQFDHQPSAKLAAALNELDSSIESLDLSANELGRIDLAPILKIIKARKISLTNNDLHQMNEDDLAAAFEQASPTITSWDLSRNALGSLTSPGLIKIFASIRNRELDELKIDYNGFSAKSFSERDAIAQSFPMRENEIVISSETETSHLNGIMVPVNISWVATAKTTGSPIHTKSNALTAASLNTYPTSQPSPQRTDPGNHVTAEEKPSKKCLRLNCILL